MRTKILTLLINTLDAQEREHPTSAATRTGMELAVVALGVILKRLTYINHRADLQMRLADERDLRRQAVSALEEERAKLLRHNETLTSQNANQKNTIHGQKQEIKKLNEKIESQKVALAAFNKFK
jgi:acyl transferase domain-containing protein